jgi:iron complex transport system ATP-binding protein
MLEVKELHFNYGNTTILKGVSFDVNEGELCGLFGPNGCGKTTLFKCCLNFLKSHLGSIRMDGKDVKDLRSRIWPRSWPMCPRSTSLHSPIWPGRCLDGQNASAYGFFGISRRIR